MEQAILSSTYLGSVGYFTILSRFENVLIEQYDSYHKQTYRNRCRILGANGPLDLIIPVVKNSGHKTLVKDMKIDFSTRWQSIHWRSLFSAYNSSPFFEFYSEYLYPFYQKKWTFLIDFNLEIMEEVMGLIQIKKNYLLTEHFQKEYDSTIDMRDQFSPKKQLINLDGEVFNYERYTQTFSGKFDFIPDLSIVDLLFNCGPDSEMILQKNFSPIFFIK